MAAWSDELLGHVGQGPDSGLLEIPASPPPAAAGEPSVPAPAPAVLTPGGARGPLSGRSWPGYEIGDLIGCGGMGEVYRALQIAVGRVVALKAMPAGASDPGLRARFAAEATAAARIDSPHAVRVHDSGEHDGRMWLAMEYVAGRSLAELLRERSPLAPAEAGGLALQAARGLAAAHAVQLVHRDIKPANLLLAADGTLKVADFGLVRIVDGRTLTRTGMVLGTPQYLAPEQGRGLATGPAGDVYSLGAVLYELLTGRPPFDGDSADSLIFQHNFAEPVLPARINPDVPQDLQAVCLLCLQKDPARRYRDGAALALDLGRILGGLAPVSAVFAPGQLGTGAAAALARAGGVRRRLLPVLAALALAAAAGAGGWWWMQERRGAIAELRARLAPVAQVAALPDTAAGDLDALAARVGAGDPQVAAGRRKLAAVDELAQALDRALAAGDGAALTAGLERLAELVGADGDARMARWKGWLAGRAARLAELRQRLAPALAGRPLLPRAQRERLGGELAAFLAAAPAADPDRAAWQALLARSDQEAAALRARLARCADPAPPASAELDALEADCASLAALEGEDAVDPSWRRRIAAERRAIAAAQGALGRLLAAGVPTPAERAAAAAALAELGGRQMLAAAEAAEVRARLDSLAGELAALDARLGALDRPGDPPPDTAAALARRAVLVAADDPAQARWNARLARIRALQQELAVVDRPGQPPERCAGDLDALAALVGDEDPALQRWRARLAAIAALRRPVAALLAAPGPLPDAAATWAADLAAQVGEADAQVRALRQRSGDQHRLAAALDAWPALVVLDDPALAQEQLTAYRALAGDDARAQAAARRLAELLGPGRPAWAVAAGRDRHGPWCELEVGGARMRLHWLPPLTGAIGSPADEEGRHGDEAQVQVRLTRGRWVAGRECTQGLWAAVMGAVPSRSRDPLLPVESLTAADAEAFCARLGALLPGCAARLPGEAEWELAMRAGAAGPFGSIPPAQASAAIAHHGLGLADPRPTGSGPPNPIGLRDGPGNLWEWCAGAYGPQPTGSPAVDPRPADGPLRVARGGSWGDGLLSSRLARRLALPATARSCYLGFRFVVDGGAP